jgi:hypothetical protein
MTTQAQVSGNAMLVRLSISMFTGRKLDRKASKSTKEQNGATEKAGVKVYKSIVSAEALEKISAVSSKARAQHETRTVPWVYKGPGAITAAGYAGYMATMNGLKAEFLAAVDSFMSGYADYREAARADLGVMFNDSDYPAADIVRSKFDFDVAAEQMPVANDFRVALGTGEADKIRADIERRFNDAMSGAARAAWERIAERVGHMAEKLRAFKPSAGKGDKADGIFRDSLVDNVRELVAVLPSLNITGDAALTRIADRMQRELCAVDASALRDSDSARNAVAESAESIMAEVARSAESTMQDAWAKRRAARTAGVVATVSPSTVPADMADATTGEMQAA